MISNPFALLGLNLAVALSVMLVLWTFTARRGDATAVVEHLDGLREVGDAREQRDVLGREAARIATSAPVLVERADRLGRFGGKTELERDRRTAVAANLDQLTRRPWRARDGDQLPRAGDEPVARRDHPRRLEREASARVPVDRLHARLHGLVVRPEQCRHPPGVARAAGVLQ